MTHEKFVALCKQTLFCVPHLLQVGPAIIQSLQSLQSHNTDTRIQTDFTMKV